jgi:hypothetical protein
MKTQMAIGVVALLLAASLAYAQSAGSINTYQNLVLGTAGEIIALWAVLAIYAIVGFFLLVFMILDCLRHQSENQFAWLAIIFFLPVFGGLVYYFKVKRARRSIPVGNTNAMQAQVGPQMPHNAGFPIKSVLLALVATILFVGFFYYTIFNLAFSLPHRLESGFVNATANTPEASLDRPYLAMFNASFNPIAFEDNNNAIVCVGMPGWNCSNAKFDPGGLLYTSIDHVSTQPVFYGNTIIACAAATDANGRPLAQNTSLQGYNGFYSLNYSTSGFPGGWWNCAGGSTPCGSNLQIPECFGANGRPLNTTELQQPLTEYIYLAYNSSGTLGPIDTVKRIAAFSSKPNALTTTTLTTSTSTTSVIPTGTGPGTNNTNFGPSCQSSSSNFGCNLIGLYQNGTAILDFNDSFNNEFYVSNLTCTSYFQSYSWRNSVNATISYRLNNSPLSVIPPVLLMPDQYQSYPSSYEIAIPCYSKDGSFNFNNGDQVELSISMGYGNSASSSNDHVHFNVSTYGGSVD